MFSVVNRILQSYVNKNKCSLFHTQQTTSKGGVLSLDLHLVCENPNLVLAHLAKRRSSASVVGNVAQIGKLKIQRNKLLVEVDAARNRRKKLSNEIGSHLKASNLDKVAELKSLVEKENNTICAIDEILTGVESEMNALFSSLPNLIDESVPDGNEETDNVVIKSWGDDLRKIGPGFLWHDEVAKSLRGIDNNAANRLSGSRFSVLLGSVARLERALIQYFVDFHVDNGGYQEVSVPYIVGRSALEGTGQLPKFEEDLFRVSHQVGGQDAFLIPTAEVPLTNLFRDQILTESELPLRFVSHTPSFRAEVGSHGRDSRGLLRQHQFHKVELVKICSPETSEVEHELLTQDAEKLLESLQLPYRRLLLCSADTGFAASKCFDLEVWLPGQQAYREISSCSNCHDFQARRMNLRYRDAAGERDKGTKKSTRFPHTINGSGLAVGRTLAAILENFQLADGSCMIPEKLQPYMNNDKFLKINPRISCS